ncbi:YaiI/YqxD family protein [Alteromonas sp. IB21]|uniref:YaiI/YqxD family protein n=1 Tax=Alteromonas sp. IB21 TaxID=2779369 RepID=UPI0018E8E355|nr:YaiI/YqxD family protein [Alteromonas sp. IB21]MBJ2129654.1 YaiI/YqxD family protein [Alteromonas sp. IB21]|tara:strand:+ start:108 stop:566 length:459 start_codon:yes stop_codon:yes gene_type:complete
MHIWVDADACPAVIKDILFKAARRTKLPLSLVANHSMSVPPDKHITLTQVPSGFDAADDYIVEKCEAGDLVITNDIPLAADVLAKNALALNNRGEEYDKSSIKQILGMRDFMDTMRSSGEHTGGPKAFSQRDKQNFANALDRLLTQGLRALK